MNAMGTPLLEVIGINARYGDLQVLDGVSLRVEEGEVVTLVGANGAGKTTTINAISGLVHATEGKLKFVGVEVQAAAPKQRVDIGLIQVPEGRHLFPFMTVQENIELGAYTPRARKDRDQTLEEVLTLLPRLKERFRQMAGTLSGGEQQMLAIARGLMSKPRLLMLDEPTLGLAPKIVTLVFDTIQAIQSRGVTVLLVEQNVNHALKIANRGYVLENGRVVLEGSGSELLADERLKKAYLGL
jgi:branched-chain amino acid transport system ATP-binding protein